jgi:hypothetical protein
MAAENLQIASRLETSFRARSGFWLLPLVDVQKRGSMDNARKRAWPFPLWRLHSDHSHRSADQCPETPPEHQELSVADALRTSVVTGNYLQINSPWPIARTRGFPLYSHRCCLGHLAETLSSKTARHEKRSISLSAVVVEPTSRSGTQTDWKKDLVCAVRAGAPPVLSVYSAWRPRIDISP